ncbi:MAG: MarR family winged helix-turn-helix transcriptional regulator [Planctomycetota bacterium]
MRAHEAAQEQVIPILKRVGLSGPTYNVLRILRGARPKGLRCGTISERMVTRVPDVTRLVDRLEGLGFVRRERAEGDRRVVEVSITKRGLEVLAELDEPLVDAHRRQFGSLARAEIAQLRRLLDKLSGER